MPRCQFCSTEVPDVEAVCPSCCRPIEEAGRSPRATTRVSSLAVASLYLSIIALLFPLMMVYVFQLNPADPDYLEDAYLVREGLAKLITLLSFLLVLGSVAAGWKAQQQIKKSGGSLMGMGRAWAGLAIGCAAMVLYAPVFTFALKSETRFLGPQGDFISGLGSLRTVSAAAETYRTTYQRGFPISLAVLGPPGQGGVPSADAAGLVDPILASGKKEGYVFIYLV